MMAARGAIQSDQGGSRLIKVEGKAGATAGGGSFWPPKGGTPNLSTNAPSARNGEALPNTLQNGVEEQGVVKADQGRSRSIKMESATGVTGGGGGVVPPKGGIDVRRREHPSGLLSQVLSLRSSPNLSADAPSTCFEDRGR